MIFNKIVASILALLTFLFAFLVIYRVKDTNAFDNKNWMKNIDGEKYLAKFQYPALTTPVLCMSRFTFFSMKIRAKPLS